MSEKVADETARLAVDRLVEGATKDQALAGQIPSPSAFSDLARKMVADQVARHEDGANRSTIRKTGEAPDRISRGDVGPDTTPISRFAGTEADGITRVADKAVPPDPLLQARLFRLSQDPIWFQRLFKAHLDGEVAAMKLGINDPAGRNSIVADFVIEAASQSATVTCHKCGGFLGDWRIGGACESCTRKRYAGSRIQVG